MKGGGGRGKELLPPFALITQVALITSPELSDVYEHRCASVSSFNIRQIVDGVSVTLSFHFISFREQTKEPQPEGS